MTLTDEQIEEIKARADIPLLISALEVANKRVAELEALVYVPGLWKCAKCDFVLVQSTLNARDGTITPRNEPGDKCPNCASPLWRVSWKSEAADRLATFEQCFDQAATLKARVAVMQEALEIIAGKRQCLDNLMGNKDVALAALTSKGVNE